MIGYASWTGTKTTLRRLQLAGWRILMSPDTLIRCKGKTRPFWTDGSPAPYALDNGAWGCHKREEPFNEDRFEWALDRIGAGADWVVMPDCVGNSEETFRMADRWWRKMLEYPMPLFAVQDGMAVAQVEPFLKRGFGLFVGGSMEWKLATVWKWAQLAQKHDRWCHVGRINTVRRIRLCQAYGVNSTDGTQITQYPGTMPRFDRAFRQQALFELKYKGEV